MSLMNASIGFIIVVTIGALLSVGARVLIMLAISEDAKAIAVKNRTLWMVLSFFIPICAIVYLCIRNTLEKNSPKYCPHCGATSAPNSYACINCGNPALLDYQVADAEKHKKSRKNYLVAGIVAYVLSVVIILVGYFAFLGTMINDLIYDDFNDYGYHEYNDDPFEFYDDFFEDFD